MKRIPLLKHGLVGILLLMLVALPGAAQPRAALMGDSITELWLKLHPDFFSANNLLGCGISGQVSGQMLDRFQKDVIDQHPAIAVINAGTNDIAENKGAYDEDVTFSNIIAMVEMARRNGIQPVMTSVLPAAAFRWRPSVTDAPDKIASLNARLLAWALENDIPYVNYYAAMVTLGRAMDAAYSKDGVHPTAEGYDVMEPILLRTLKTL
ncbi:MAG: lipase [Bacteroidales bacterium]|nr:lipase [Bacteroidales bacterium]MBR5100973.1 lipase [Bacteroidales bacterium]